MKLRPRAVFGSVLVAIAFAAACADDGAGPDGDAGGVDPPPPQPARRLVLETPAAMTLALGQTAEIAVRYEGDEGAVVGEPVRFALVGSAHDSTLSALDMVTDGSGRAAVTLTAGGVVAVFQVRASAERAAPAYADVGVSDEGFGTVIVEAPYHGTRAVTSARVAAYANLPCDRLVDPATNETSPPDVERDVGSTDATAVFSALPSGIRYALLGRAYGPSGVEVARGCVDRVEVGPGEQVSVQLVWIPHEIRSEGGFGVSARVLALGRAQAARARVRAAVGGAVAPWGGDASMYLNEVLADVDARDPRVADDLRALFASSSLTGDLAVALASASAGPWRVASDAGDTVATVLSAPTMRGTLNLTPRSGRSVDALFVFAGIHTDTPSGEVVHVPAPDLLTPATVALVAERNAEDYLDFVGTLNLVLPPAALVRRAIASELGVSDDLAMARVVERAIDCETFVDWTEAQGQVAAACDASCALAACGRVSEQLVTAIEDELTSLDEEASDLSVLGGSVVVLDTTGDLLPDAVSGDGWRGSWGRDGDSRVTLVIAGETAAP